MRQALVASTAKNQAVKTSLRKEATRVIRTNFFEPLRGTPYRDHFGDDPGKGIRMGVWRCHWVTELLRASIARGAPRYCDLEHGGNRGDSSLASRGNRLRCKCLGGE